jgi:hypothetical protein
MQTLEFLCGVISFRSECVDYNISVLLLEEEGIAKRHN